jgi:hypothetical protein
MIYPQYLAKVYKENGEHRYFENQNRIHNEDMAVSRELPGLGVYLWFVFANARMANLKSGRNDEARKSCNRIVNLTRDANNTYNKYAKETLTLFSEKQNLRLFNFSLKITELRITLRAGNSTIRYCVIIRWKLY